MSTFTDYLTGIADAIRAKKGTAEAIPATNFATEIENLPTGMEMPGKGIVFTEWGSDGYPTKCDIVGLTSVTTAYIGYSENTFLQKLTAVNIDNTTTNIEANAFNGHLYLTSINLPQALTSIGAYAFKGCIGLTSIVIPSTVITAGSSGGSPFKDCTNLSTVILEEGMTTVPAYMFWSCTQPFNVTIPSTVTSLRSWAFAQCTGLTSITIPKSVTSIASATYSPFEGCTVPTVILEEGMTEIPGYIFRYCGMTSITIPSSVTSIGGGAFLACNYLTSITIPKSVTYMGSAFAPCFGICNSLATATFEDGITRIPDYAFRECSGLVTVNIPPSATTIASYAFYSCANLTNVSPLGGVGSPMVSISSNAFASCPLVTALTVYTAGGAALADAPWGATNATVTYIAA